MTEMSLVTELQLKLRRQSARTQRLGLCRGRMLVPTVLVRSFCLWVQHPLHRQKEFSKNLATVPCRKSSDASHSVSSSVPKYCCQSFEVPLPVFNVFVSAHSSQSLFKAHG